MNLKALDLKHHLAVELAIRAFPHMENDANVSNSFDLAEKLVNRIVRETKMMEEKEEEQPDLAEILINILRKQGA